MSLRCGKQNRQNPPREALANRTGDFRVTLRVLTLADDFKTVSGKEYKNATVSRVEPDGIVIRTKGGISKVYFTELPKDVQKRFHYHFAQDAHVTANREATVEQQNAAPAGHRLGETADQFAARHGAPNDSPGLDKNFSLLQGAIHHTYAYEGWRIRVAFLAPDGPAVRMEYSKIIKAGVNAVIQDYELQAIMTANTAPGTTWKEITYDNPDSPNKGLSKIAEGYGSTWREDVATQRRRDSMAAQQSHCPP